MTTTPFSLGTYVGNPDGTDPAAEAAFEAQYNAFVQDLGGARPQFMDTYTDFTQAPSAWGSNAAWDAWSWAGTGVAYVGPGSGTVPVVGVPLASNAGGWSNVDTFYQQIIAGDYDSDYKAIVDAWAGEGYQTVQFRPGYEFNTSLMPWSPSDSASPTADADFVAAFQHVANLIHAEGAADGITAQVVWNPADVNWSADPTQLYPGNQYVDVIGTDAYSPAYPVDLTTWSSASATSAGPQASSQSAWAASTADLEHFWQYSNASQSDATPGLGSTGWSLENAIAFAKQQGKPLAIEETGAGANGSGLGPADDPAFPQWLAGALAAAQAEGVTIQNVNIWDTDVSDGSWGFTGGEKPLEAAAWGQYFGAGTAAAIAPVTLGSGSDTLALSIAGGSGNAQFTVAIDGTEIGGVQTLAATQQAQTVDVAGSFAAGSHTVTIDLLDGSPALYVTGATIDGSTVAGAAPTVTAGAPQSFTFDEAALATLSFSDAAGHSFTEAAQIAGSQALYSGQTGLDSNLDQWVYDGVRYVSSGAWGYVTTAAVTDNTGASYALSGFVEADASLTGAPGQAATLTVSTAQRGTITLGSGNDDVTFTAANAWGTAADNTVSVTMGSGSDTFSLTGSNGLTHAVVQAGSGEDQMQFIGLAGATVDGGAGSASVIAGAGTDTFVAGSGSLAVTAGSGAETFVFHAGAGLLTIADFSPALGDTLNIDASLLGAMQETAQGGGLLLTFGTGPGGAGSGHGILLQGVSSLPSAAVHAA